jgi:hypothetical protein
MSYSLCLLTATWLTAQQPEPPLAPPYATPTTVSSTQIIPVTGPEDTPPQAPPATPMPGPSPQVIRVTPTAQPTPPPSPPSPGLLGRIRNFFSVRREEPVKVQPPSVTVQAPTKVTTLRPSIEMSAKELEKVGHDKDYAWITGKLSRIAGGHWVLHYAGPYEVDRYDGCVMLAPSPNLAKFHDGDLVCTVGKILPTRAPRPHAGAVYEATEINLIDAGKR